MLLNLVVECVELDKDGDRWEGKQRWTNGIGNGDGRRGH
jgi:hypothetical protein